MTNREVRNFITEVSPSPGYILNLSKTQLSDLVYEETNLELEDYSKNGTSNAKRLALLLETVDNDIALKVVDAIKKQKDTK